MSLHSLATPDRVPQSLWQPGPSHLSTELLETWRFALASLGAPEAARNALARLPESRVVVTGQQPGPWGGPLYSAYKAATAVALARRLEAETGEPAAAVFWMGADDADHDEVGWGCLPDARGKLFRHRWPSPADSRSWVGDRLLDFPDGVNTFLEKPPDFWGAPAPESKLSLGEGFARFLIRTFGEAGLLVLDARWPEVSRAGLPLWHGYLERHEAIQEAVDARGRELADAGMPAPLEGQSGQGLFLIGDRRREEVEAGEWARAAEHLVEQGRQVTPSVLLRAPLQDYLFGTAAHVVGRGEAAYLEQLKPVYSQLEIHRPPRIPRLSGTVVPRGWVKKEALEEALADPEAYVARQVEGPDAALSALREAMVSELKSVEALYGNDQAGREAVHSTAKKLNHQIDRLHQQLDRQARRDLYRRHPHLKCLPEFLLPRRGPQDRGLSALSLWLWLGDGAGKGVLDWAEAHVTALAEGSARAWIMEIDHD